MATVFSHGIVGWTAGKLLLPKSEKNIFFLSSCFILPMLPDLDSIGYFLGVPYESAWGHRGITHSILFAVTVGLIWALFFHRKEKSKIPLLGFFYALIVASHGLLDALTSGGLGVAFFAPYHSIRYFFPWRPIRVSPMGMGVFSERGIAVLISEFVWLILPCLILLIAQFMIRKLRSKNQ